MQGPKKATLAAKILTHVSGDGTGFESLLIVDMLIQGGQISRNHQFERVLNVRFLRHEKRNSGDINKKVVIHKVSHACTSESQIFRTILLVHISLTMVRDIKITHAMETR